METSVQLRASLPASWHGDDWYRGGVPFAWRPEGHYMASEPAYRERIVWLQYEKPEPCSLHPTAINSQGFRTFPPYLVATPSAPPLYLALLAVWQMVFVPGSWSAPRDPRMPPPWFDWTMFAAGCVLLALALVPQL